MIKIKGQSAIEYLITYGWMLVTIAIVGGAIFTTVQDRSSVQSVSGLNGDVRVEDFAVGEDGGLQAELRAATSDPVEISNFSLTDSETDETVFNCESLVVAVGETDSVNITGVERSETSNTFDIAVYYDIGELDDLKLDGSITGSFDLNSSLSCNKVPEPMTSSSLEVEQK